jgi:hypothetical protein
MVKATLATFVSAVMVGTAAVTTTTTITIATIRATEGQGTFFLRTLLLRLDFALLFGGSTVGGHASWEIAQNALIAVYSKQWKDGMQDTERTSRVP